MFANRFFGQLYFTSRYFPKGALSGGTVSSTGVGHGLSIPTPLGLRL